MAGDLTDVAEDLVLDWLNPDVSAPDRPVSPLKVALLSAAGSDGSAGTEVTGGGYARQNVTLSAASGGATSNTADLVFTDMPVGDVVAVAIYDSSGSPRRLWTGPLDETKTIANAGDTFTIDAGSLDLSLD
ncbi:phage tail fiber protein [Streptomyces antibioticus]|uniref:phage tail fiber protein n=1 Tax=Streptomyces antibioticus TaxID=1890 RepID=UPI0033F122FB